MSVVGPVCDFLQLCIAPGKNPVLPVRMTPLRTAVEWRSERESAHAKYKEAYVDRYQSLAVALESEVLSEMAGTFFGARKALEDFKDDFMFRVEELRSAAAKVHSRVFFLRSLLLGAEGEAALFASLGLPPQFSGLRPGPGLAPWRPERLPWALSSSGRYVKLVVMAYAEVRHACEVYMRGEYEDDPAHKGRKRMGLHYAMVEQMAARLNQGVEKLNADMPPSATLLYARGISTVEAPGQGAITNALGAESLDKGLQFEPVDFAALDVWRAPTLPEPEECAPRLRKFAAEYYSAHSDELRRVLAAL
ncbi:hypothetical protein [Humidesulfovibrio mexicanus]|uniref:hypothetical protein n=1 Tax=Humidesulfovibrio mexicanus TaxID=147047 RepID=UPI0011789C4D|nr:hypothetical protein [Humidesulfovibrio mexicanus]